MADASRRELRALNTKLSRPPSAAHPLICRRNRKACIIIRALGELAPRFGFFLPDLANQMSISKAEGGQGSAPIRGCSSKLAFGWNIAAVKQLELF